MANNGKTSAEMSEKLLNAFEILAKAEVSAAQFDKTITGIVISCEDEASGRYRIQYQNSMFYAYSSALDITYAKGTSVQVKIPNNDFSGRKMIIGTVAENGIDYGTTVEDPLLRYENIGINCIQTLNPGELCSYWSEEDNNIILYDRENNNIDMLNIDTETLATNIKKGDSVLLGGIIKTSLPSEQRFKGNYGIRYTLTFNDITNIGNTIDRYYTVDIDKMSGDPYNYESPTSQIIPFDIDGQNFLYIKKIELFARNFPYQAVQETGVEYIKPDKDADIFITDICFQVADKLSDEEFAGTALTILTPEGNYFNETENYTSKQVIAQLRIKGKITDGLSKKIQYYWFIEDLTVDKSNNKGYQKYGGRGWRCLNQFNTVSEDEDDEENDIVDYISGKDTFYVEKENSNARETKYKVVVIYNGAILEKEFSFLDYTNTAEVTIITDKTPIFYDSLGSVSLTCVADGAVSYKWVKVDAEGGFTSLSDTAADNLLYNNAATNYNNLLQAIEEKTQPNNETNQSLLANYLNTIQNYDNKERREENRIINLQAGTIFQEATFKCQAFDINNISLGIAQQKVINTLKQGDNELAGNLTILNGTQVYKYTADGLAPTSELFEEPQLVLPLSFMLRTAEGIEVPMTALRDTDIAWIVPTKNTLLKNYVGSLVSHDENLGLEIYNGKNLGYNINENYYANKTNNEIELQVVYKGILYTAKTNLLFLKDGNNGTNGTDYVVKIIPEDTIGRLKTVTNGDTGSNWFRAQLWYNGIKIFDSNHNGTAESTGKTVTVTWSMVGDIRAAHNITVTSNGNNPPVWVASNTFNSNATDIAKVTIDYDGQRLVATAPIIYADGLNKNAYKMSLANNSGFTHVYYSEDGRTPYYENNSPFQIAVHKKINGNFGDITGDPDLSYNWVTIGDLNIKNGYEDTDDQVLLEPVGAYNSESTYHAIACSVLENDVPIATLHIPIHFLLNTYGHAALNDWDGNSIQLDADGNTMLLAPQAGFGRKETDPETGSNLYTGVLLGTIKDYSNNGYITEGMFGYKMGVRTFVLNSANGSAIFGNAEHQNAQIVIDPDAGKALLYSGDFYKNYNSKTGLPSSYNSTNESGSGAIIDLTTPEIRWGNGNFKVNKDGHITAKGGGQIAGWNIDDNALFTATKNSNSNVQIASADFTRTINGTSRSDWRMAFSNNFGVSSGGIMHAASGIIGSGTTKITLGKNSDSSNSAIYSGKNDFNSTSSGFYIGTDGIALGAYSSSTGNSAFQVTKDGVLTARSGYIGNGSSGWTIGNTYIHNNKTGRSTAPTSGSTGVYIGTNGIGLGALNDYKNITGASSTDNHSKFEVTNAGVLYAKDGYFDGKIVSTSGQIGGWTLGSTYLRGAPATAGSTDYIQINSNGSITSPKWTLNRNGAASFSSITITGGSLNINNGVFKVDTNGAITSTSGRIGNWNISNGALTNGNVTLTSDGKINATDGQIGGWTIGTNKLTGGNINLNANGSISGGSTYTWSIGTDGTAVFNKITGKNADITGKITANDGTFNNVTITNTCTISGAAITDATISSAKISTLNGSKIVDGTVSNAKIGSMAASKITSGTVDTNNFVVKTSVGYLRVGTGIDNPYVSALNVGYGSGGISFRSGADVDTVGSQIGNIQMDRSTGYNIMYIRASGGINCNDGALRILSDSIRTPAINTSHIWMGDHVLNDDTGSQLAMQYNINLWSSSGNKCYANGTQIGGTNSTLNIKENIKERQLTDIPNILRKIKIYDYNYKSGIYNGEQDYGYIIDYLEKIPNLDKYIQFVNVKNGEYDTKVIKSQEQFMRFLLSSVIQLQQQIDELKKEIKGYDDFK